MGKRDVLVLVITVFVTGGVFAQDIPGCDAETYVENDAVRMPKERSGVFTAVGGGIVADTSRSGETIDYRFWSQIYTGPWFFMDAGFVELSLGLTVGRLARRNRWCFLILAANPSLLFRIPFSVLDISPLLGIAFDAILWVRHECLRSYEVVTDAVPDGRTFRNFSSLKFKAGFGKDFDLSENRFFRVRLLGYYGRRLGNPHPWGGTLRLGFGRRLSG